MHTRYLYRDIFSAQIPDSCFRREIRVLMTFSVFFDIAAIGQPKFILFASPFKQ